jgi:hypothetical protein
MAAPDPSNPSHRTKAHQLRKAISNGQTLAEVDALWLSEYEEKQQRRPGGSKHYGRSRSGRKVDLHIEEAAEAEGEGSPATAAAAAAAHALATREEGRRLDALTINSVTALKEACAVYKDICLTLRERAEVLEATHVSMLEAVRGHFAARTEAEMALMHEQQSGDPAKDLLVMMIAKKLGIPVDVMGGLPPGKPRPGGPPKPKP